jgi:transcriptional regulator with XRE-family HTH domain
MNNQGTHMENFVQTLQNARNSDGYWLGRVKLHAATQLQDLLASSSMNQEQYATKLGVKPPQVSRMLNGLGNPTLETLVKMGRALGYVPRVTFVQDAAQAATFDAQTDEADIQLDIHREDAKPTCKVLLMQKHRIGLNTRIQKKDHTAYDGCDIQWLKAA